MITIRRMKHIYGVVIRIKGMRILLFSANRIKATKATYLKKKACKPVMIVKTLLIFQ